MRSDVQLVPGPPACAFNPEKPISPGAVAQLGERELCKLEVVGSIPIGSTSLRLRSSEGCRNFGSASQVAIASVRDGASVSTNATAFQSAGAFVDFFDK